MQKIGDIPNTRADNNGEFTDGNVAGGVPPTILPAEWFNTIQRELINILTAADIEPDSDKFDQVATAVSKLITAGGFLKTANNLSEIKTAGAAAIAATLANLGLSDVAHLPQLTGVIGTSRNARMSVTSASASAAFAVDEIIVQSSIGGLQYKLSNIGKNINLGTSGAGGTNGTVPNNGFAAIYLIYNPVTSVSALFATNATSATVTEVCPVAMPDGYTSSALVSIWRVSGGLFVVGYQDGRRFVGNEVNILTTSTGQSTPTQLSFTSAAPLNSKSIGANVSVNGGPSGAVYNLATSLYAGPNGIGRQAANITSTNYVTYLEIITPVSGVTYYSYGYGSASTNSLVISIVSYTF